MILLVCSIDNCFERRKKTIYLDLFRLYRFFCHPFNLLWLSHTIYHFFPSPYNQLVQQLIDSAFEMTLLHLLSVGWIKYFRYMNLYRCDTICVWVSSDDFNNCSIWFFFLVYFIFGCFEHVDTFFVVVAVIGNHYFHCIINIRSLVNGEVVTGSCQRGRLFFYNFSRPFFYTWQRIDKLTSSTMFSRTMFEYGSIEDSFAYFTYYGE